MARPKLTLARLIERGVFNPRNARHARLLDEDDSIFAEAADPARREVYDWLRDLVLLYRQADPNSNGPEVQGDGRVYRRKVAEAVQALVEQGDPTLYAQAMGFESPAWRREWREVAQREVLAPCWCGECVHEALKQRPFVLAWRSTRHGPRAIHGPTPSKVAAV